MLHAHPFKITAASPFQHANPPATASLACTCRLSAGKTMQLHLDRWLLAALLLSAICCSAAADGDVEAANFFNKINVTVCTDNVCPAGQYASPSGATFECKSCPIGSFKVAAGKGCCETCKLPELTFNVSNGELVLWGATGCGKCQRISTTSQLPGRTSSCTWRSSAHWLLVSVPVP